MSLRTMGTTANRYASVVQVGIRVTQFVGVYVCQNGRGYTATKMWMSVKYIQQSVTQTRNVKTYRDRTLVTVEKAFRRSKERAVVSSEKHHFNKIMVSHIFTSVRPTLPKRYFSVLHCYAWLWRHVFSMIYNILY